MLISDRLSRLGSGVFDRNDRRKAAYGRSPVCAERPLIDLSLGSTDLLPPPAAVQAMAFVLKEPSSSSYCLHAGTEPFRQAAAAWCQQRFGVSVDADREVCCWLVPRRGRPICRSPYLIQGIRR